MDEYECELCQRTNEGFGNNGQPVVDGRVCDVCNAVHVLPARLMAMRPTKKRVHRRRQARDVVVENNRGHRQGRGVPTRSR